MLNLAWHYWSQATGHSVHTCDGFRATACTETAQGEKALQNTINLSLSKPNQILGGKIMLTSSSRGFSLLRVRGVRDAGE